MTYMSPQCRAGCVTCCRRRSRKTPARVAEHGHCRGSITYCRTGNEKRTCRIAGVCVHTRTNRITNALMHTCKRAHLYRCARTHDAERKKRKQRQKKRLERTPQELQSSPRRLSFCGRVEGECSSVLHTRARAYTHKHAHTDTHTSHCGGEAQQYDMLKDGPPHQTEAQDLEHRCQFPNTRQSLGTSSKPTHAFS